MTFQQLPLFNSHASGDNLAPVSIAAPTRPQSPTRQLPIRPVDPKAPADLTPDLSDACMNVLRALLTGPKTTKQLIDAGGGMRAGARVYDLTEYGVRVDGQFISKGQYQYTLIYTPPALLALAQRP